MCHIALAKAGVLKIDDKIKYGTRLQRLGGLAEKEFQKLVPDAVDANKLWKQNNPAFDFRVHGLTVDVKYSSILTGNHWKVDVSHKKPDFYCVFCESEEGMEIDNCHILLIPNGFIQTAKTLHISRSGMWFNEFRVKASELNNILTKYISLTNPDTEESIAHGGSNV